MFDLQTLSLHHDAQQGVGELTLHLTPAAWALSHRCIAQTHTCFPVFCVPDSLCVSKSKCRSSIVVPYLASHLISLWTRGNLQPWHCVFAGLFLHGLLSGSASHLQPSPYNCISFPAFIFPALTCNPFLLQGFFFSF